MTIASFHERWSTADSYGVDDITEILDLTLRKDCQDFDADLVRIEIFSVSQRTYERNFLITRGTNAATWTEMRRGVNCAWSEPIKDIIFFWSGGPEGATPHEEGGLQFLLRSVDSIICKHPFSARKNGGLLLSEIASSPVSLIFNPKLVASWLKYVLSF